MLWANEGKWIFFLKYTQVPFQVSLSVKLISDGNELYFQQEWELLFTKTITFPSVLLWNGAWSDFQKEPTQFHKCSAFCIQIIGFPNVLSAWHQPVNLISNHDPQMPLATTGKPMCH